MRRALPLENASATSPFWDRFFPVALRYSTAPALVFLATALIQLIHFWTRDSTSYLLYVVAVVLTTWFADRGPGALSIVLSALALDFFFISPVWILSFSLKSLIWTFIFIYACVFAYLVSLQRKRVEGLLEQARNELEERVRMRTGELIASNNQLLLEIAERERAAHEVQSLQSEMARMSRILTVGALTASITHEIAQPLTSVVANCEAALGWLGREPPDIDKSKRSVSSALSAGQRAANILKHIRSLIDQGPSRLSLIQLPEIVETALSLSRSALWRSKIHVERKISKDCRPILGDRIQIEQLLLNLVNNSIDALAEVGDRRRTITISIGMNDDNRVEMIFRDNGCGMQAVETENVFRPFFSTKTKGIGMGLSIVGLIVSRHGGSIRVRSWPNLGTEFCLSFAPGDDHETSRQHRIYH
jgi:C4-dicarboxylate-specific signal transduction histidine kinase